MRTEKHSAIVDNRVKRTIVKYCALLKLTEIKKKRQNKKKRAWSLTMERRNESMAPGNFHHGGRRRNAGGGIIHYRISKWHANHRHRHHRHHHHNHHHHHHHYCHYHHHYLLRSLWCGDGCDVGRPVAMVTDRTAGIYIFLCGICFFLLPPVSFRVSLSVYRTTQQRGTTR